MYDYQPEILVLRIRVDNVCTQTDEAWAEARRILPGGTSDVGWEVLDASWEPEED